MNRPNEILPGGVMRITNNDASNIKSISIPFSPVILAAPLTRNIAPNIIIDNTDAEILVKIPEINKMPPINSASAIGICISTGNPIIGKNPAKPASNFDIP